MKKLLLYIFISTLFLDCSSDESKDDPTNGSEPDLSNYVVDCSGFVKFDSDDSSFLNFLISKGYDLNTDSKISCDEASKIVTLDLGNAGVVKNLIGVESFTNLKIITGYIELPVGTNNKARLVLNLYNNSNLEEINFNVRSKSNFWSSIPTIVLPKNSKLKKIDCSVATIKNLINLSTQTNLETVNFQGSGIIGEVDLSGSNKLTYLNLSRNEITEIKFSSVTNNTLKEINLGGTTITNITDSNNSIKAIKLETFANLETLDLSYNKFTEIDISKNSKLISLNVSSNNLLKIDLSNNKTLTTLRLDSNPISILNLNDLTTLRSLYCTNTSIENIDLSNNKLIYHVQLENNQLKSLNLKNGKNSFINSMTATKNKISCITVDNGFTPDPKKWVKDSSTKYCN